MNALTNHDDRSRLLLLGVVAGLILMIAAIVFNVVAVLA